jgi:UrcA family protein
MINSNQLIRHLKTGKNLILVVAMVAFVGLNAVAVADGNAGEARAKKVSLADIELSTIEGQRAARERLRQTARRLCSQVADELDLSHQTNYLACIDTAMTKVESRLQAMASRSGVALSARNEGK